eukprot:1124662-Amorphochlora_amoeboformis.AAC.1
MACIAPWCASGRTSIESIMRVDWHVAGHAATEIPWGSPRFLPRFLGDPPIISGSRDPGI